SVLQSFPTRRSSDLEGEGLGGCGEPVGEAEAPELQEWEQEEYAEQQQCGREGDEYGDGFALRDAEPEERGSAGRAGDGGHAASGTIATARGEKVASTRSPTVKSPSPWSMRGTFAVMVPAGVSTVTWMRSPRYTVETTVPVKLLVAVLAVSSA